jgi:hypothetical protein
MLITSLTMLTDDEEDGKNEIKTNKTETKDQYIE